MASAGSADSRARRAEARAERRRQQQHQDRRTRRQQQQRLPRPENQGGDVIPNPEGITDQYGDIVVAAVGMPVHRDGAGAEGELLAGDGAGAEGEPLAGDGSVNMGLREDMGYASSFVDEDSPPGSDWSSPRWEHRRNHRRRAPHLSPMELLPVSGFTTLDAASLAPSDGDGDPSVGDGDSSVNRKTETGRSGRKKLPPGVIRNRVGTWVTDEDGRSAFYVRKAVEVGSFDFNSCGEYPPAGPPTSLDRFSITLVRSPGFLSVGRYEKL